MCVSSVGAGSGLSGDRGVFSDGTWYVTSSSTAPMPGRPSRTWSLVSGSGRSRRVARCVTSTCSDSTEIARSPTGPRTTTSTVTGVAGGCSGLWPAAGSGRCRNSIRSRARSLIRLSRPSTAAGSRGRACSTVRRCTPEWRRVTCARASAGRRPVIWMTKSRLDISPSVLMAMTLMLHAPVGT